MEPITVYDGWRLIRLEKRMDIPEAARLLCGRGRRRWANAVIEGEEAVLTGHAIRCPACGRDTPAYGDQGGRGVNKPRVLRWAARQASLFAQPERELVLSEVALPEGYFTCPHCRGCFPKNHRREQVRLERKGQKLMLSLVTADLRELLSLVDGGSALGIRLPLTEQLTFHFGRGRVVFSVTAADGACLLTRDVTDECYGWTESRICQLLATHRVLRRRVRIRKKTRKRIRCGGRHGTAHIIDIAHTQIPHRTETNAVYAHAARRLLFCRLQQHAAAARHRPL